ncbi:alpha-L-fucosidase [Anaerocolumna sp. MB42-C2]|uniref:alpha-L-fucosidase n=1 Tax=Anaerocolumna sp. MB42-C2 TaxID=3070997 RepID=UPI0027DF128D|nr:alpha-L-fucosidase [Anaerocolumna sp. MB42-C2]WMJ86556.1 alpha-L-fucosidase [Anaerocolumna sp. MB42-C2]
MKEIDNRLVLTVPSERQLNYQELEFYSFVHFTVNTFTDKEWGDGTENPAIFNPEKLDAKQWVDSIKAAGMKGLILTCKHHDGFCLWPSKYTEHTVAASPYKDGRGDIVKEVSQACQDTGIAFGVYLSPWDRNNKTYGQGKEYDDFFVHQLEELLTNYGEVFTVWFDGACGEGPNGKKQIYNWDRYYEVIRSLQPGACISVCGPDVRWCGNEAGDTRTSEWSVVPKRARDTEKIAENSQQKDDDFFRQRKISAHDSDLGSRSILEQEKDLIWYPAEVNTSIRPGWFYHENEDDKVKPLSKLIHIYNNSVGGNATFLLNIPPTKDGLFYENDVKRLYEIGSYLKKAYGKNLMDKAELKADSDMSGFEIEHVRADQYDTYFRTKDGETNCTIQLKWGEKVLVNHIVLKENIRLSQRIEKFMVQALIDGNLKTIYEGTIVGHKKIIPIDNISTSEIIIYILDARVAPTLSFLGVY